MGSHGVAWGWHGPHGGAWGRMRMGMNRPDFALNGFLSVGFQTDKKSREKNGDPESVPGLACFDVLCPSNGITGTSTYNIWRLHCVAGDMGLIWFYASKIGKQFIWLFV